MPQMQPSCTWEWGNWQARRTISVLWSLQHLVTLALCRVRETGASWCVCLPQLYIWHSQHLQYCQQLRFRYGGLSLVPENIYKWGWLLTVFRPFHLWCFGLSVLPLLVSYCYSNNMDQIPYHLSYFRATFKVLIVFLPNHFAEFFNFAKSWVLYVYVQFTQKGSSCLFLLCRR